MPLGASNKRMQDKTHLNFKATHVNMNAIGTGTASGTLVKTGGIVTSASNFYDTINQDFLLLYSYQGVKKVFVLL